MKVVENKRLSKTKVVTVTEKRRIVVNFNDPLFPGQNVRFAKTVTIKNGKLLNHPDVYYFLEQRYSIKIGGWWKTVNRDDHGGLIPACEEAERNRLTTERNEMVKATARIVNKMIADSLK